MATAAGSVEGCVSSGASVAKSYGRLWGVIVCGGFIVWFRPFDSDSGSTNRLNAACYILFGLGGKSSCFCNSCGIASLVLRCSSPLAANILFQDLLLVCHLPTRPPRYRTPPSMCSSRSCSGVSLKGGRVIFKGSCATGHVPPKINNGGLRSLCAHRCCRGLLVLSRNPGMEGRPVGRPTGASLACGADTMGCLV